MDGSVKGAPCEYKDCVCLTSFKNEADYKLALAKEGQIHGRPVRISIFTEKPDKSKSGKDANAESKPSWPVKSTEELKSAIREVGSLSDIHVSYDINQQVSKGIAFATFLFPADAVAAFEKLDKTKFMGRLLHILPAEDPPERAPRPDSQSFNHDRLYKSEYQTEKHKDLKASATTAHNWNALFIRPDAVATYLAAKFGLTKEQVLNPERGSVAVRLALAETQLVAEMREFLQKHNLDLEAFDQSLESDTPNSSSTGRRGRLDAISSSTHRQVSGTAFLIKNLPIGTTEVDVRDLLRRYTKQARDESSTESESVRFHPRRVIVPPLGITAIVEFALAQHARLVYRSLAYEPYQDNVLYVQWLPHGALKNVVDETEQQPEGTRKEDQTDEPEFEITTLPDPSLGILEPDAKSPISNKSKKRTLDNTGTNESVEAPPPKKTKKYKNKKERLRQQEQAAVEEVEQPASPETEVTPVETIPVKQTPKKIAKPVLLVRNVSFQATKKELSALFQPIGGLVRVRLPQKAAGGHRGFAFVEYATVDQAKMALETMGKDTHFLGRRLRIEYAET